MRNYIMSILRAPLSVEDFYQAEPRHHRLVNWHYNFLHATRLQAGLEWRQQSSNTPAVQGNLFTCAFCTHVYLAGRSGARNPFR